MPVLKDFKAFAMRGNVVDLAVGVVIGAGFGKIVSSLVNDVIMPPIGMVLGGIDFRQFMWVLKPAIGETPATALRYGLFLNTVLDFVIIAFSVFLLVKGVTRLRKSEPEPAADTKDCPKCCMPIPIPATRCGHCTSDLA